MHIRHFSCFAAILALASMVLVTSSAFAQTAIPLSECPDRAESTRVATDARRLQRERNLPAAMAAWDRAIALCALPDRFEGRARTGEALQGERDGEERLALLDRVIADYTQAIQRRGYVMGFNSSAIEAALPPLRLARETLDRRVHPTPPVVNSPPVIPPVAPVIVAHPNVVVPPPVLPPAVHPPITLDPTPPSRTLPRALWISGTVATVTGITLGVIGHINAVTRDENNASLALPVSERCRVVSGQAQCLGYASDTTRPEALANLEIPGWIVAGAGLAAVVTGAILEVHANHATQERPPMVDMHPSLGLGPGGTATVGLTGTFF